jgi:hypothetical protein
MLKTIEQVFRKKILYKLKRRKQVIVSPVVQVENNTVTNIAKEEEPSSLGNTQAYLTTILPINRVPNPWASMQVYRTVDANSPGGDLQADFEKYGVVLIKNLLNQDEVSRYLNDVRKITKLDDEDYVAVVKGEKQSYISPGTINREPALWPVIFNPKLIEILSSLIGEPVKYVGSDSVFVHYSSVGFHRDTDILEEISPWYHQDFKYSYMKTMFYLNDDGRQVNRMGIQPFSHLKNPITPPGWTGTPEELERFPVWIGIEPTDCFIFDPRIKHSGDTLNGPKYAVTFTLAGEGEYTLDTFFISRTRGQLEGYNEYSPEFYQRLEETGLMLNGTKDEALFKRYQNEEKEYIAGRIQWLSENGKITSERKDVFGERLSKGEYLQQPGEPKQIVYF